MKQSVVCCIALFILLVGYGSAQIPETECTGQFCTSQRGYIKYPNIHKLWIVSTPQQQQTTITIHLKNIVLRKPTQHWLRIRSYRIQLPTVTEIINTDEEKILVFRDTTAVSIQMLITESTQFRINYYIGCTVLEGRSNISIIQEPNPNPIRPSLRNQVIQTQSYSSTHNCWIVFPRIEERRRPTSEDQAFFLRLGYRQPFPFVSEISEVQETYMTLHSVSGIGGFNITINNFITGEVITQVQENEYLTTVTSRKSVSAINFNQHRYSSIFLVDRQCNNEETCQQTSFTFTAYGMKQQDLECIEEQRCRYNLGVNTNTTHCRNSLTPDELDELEDDELINTSCPAFNLISRHMREAFEYDDTAEYIGHRRAQVKKNPKRLIRRAKKCNRISHQFCEFTCSHPSIKQRKCTRLCVFFRVLHNECARNNNQVFS